MSTFVLSLLLAGALQAPDSTYYVVINHGRPAGEMVVSHDDVAAVVRYHHIDRNRGRWLHSRYVLNDGRIAAVEVRSMSRQLVPGDLVERLDVTRDSVVQTIGARRLASAVRRGGVTVPANRTPYDVARVARTLLRAGGEGAVLPALTDTRALVVADTTVSTSAGVEHVRLVYLTGLGEAVWLDEQDELFASEIGWFITVRHHAVDALPALRSIELRFRNAQAAELAKRLQSPPAQTLVIRNGDLFDSESGRVLPNMTVVVQGERVVAVGPAATTPVPRGATVVDATGKTVMPGMWEMHGHLVHTSQNGALLAQLAAGITTVRDLAADIDVAVSVRDRAAAHAIVAPRFVLGGFLEGPGAWAGPSEAIVVTEEDARRWIARYDSLGYKQVKLYNLVHPDLVPVIAAEAHRRGMRVSGHVPRGLTVPAAVKLGFDEINHAAFLFSTFFQDSLYIPQMRAYSAVASIVADSFDVDSPEMTRLIETLREHRTVIDGTFNIWMGGRSLLTGEQNAAAQNYARLIKRLHDAGVTLVPGTDNLSSGTYVTELELYEHAGIPAPAVLQLATIVSARVMGQANEYGSIAVGKVADIIIVDGQPAERIADLSRVQHVIRAGRIYDTGALRAAMREASDIIPN